MHPSPHIYLALLYGGLSGPTCFGIVSTVCHYIEIFKYIVFERAFQSCQNMTTPTNMPALLQRSPLKDGIKIA